MEPAKLRAAAVQSTPASLPRKDWNRTSTRSRRSVRRAKRLSRARLLKDGVRSRRPMTMAACRAERWNDQHCSACLLTSIRA